MGKTCTVHDSWEAQGSIEKEALSLLGGWKRPGLDSPEYGTRTNIKAQVTFPLSFTVGIGKLWYPGLVDLGAGTPTPRAGCFQGTIEDSAEMLLSLFF